VGHDEQAIGTDLTNTSTVAPRDVAKLGTDAATFLTTVRSAQADLPPNNYHGIKTAYAAGLAYAATAATDTQQAVTAMQNGDISGAAVLLSHSGTAVSSALDHLQAAANDVP